MAGLVVEYVEWEIGFLWRRGRRLAVDAKTNSSLPKVILLIAHLVK